MSGHDEALVEEVAVILQRFDTIHPSDAARVVLDAVADDLLFPLGQALANEQLATAQEREAREVAERRLAAVEALHQPGEVTDIHGELVCRACGFRDGYPCATIRAALATGDDRC